MKFQKLVDTLIICVLLFIIGVELFDGGNLNNNVIFPQSETKELLSTVAVFCVFVLMLLYQE